MNSDVAKNPAELTSLAGRVAIITGAGQGIGRAFAKAFAAAGNSRFGWATGRRTIEEARKAAADYCTSGTSAKCRVVNVNNQPVQ